MPVLPNPKHELFCQERAKGKDATAAYELAGYKPNDANASRLAAQPEVAARLAELTEAAGDKAVNDVADILRELKLIGYTDLRGLFRDNGRLKHPTEWPEEIARAVASFELVEEFEGSGRDREQIGWLKKVKFWSKIDALELLGKNRAAWTEKTETEHSGEIKLTIRDYTVKPKR